MNSRKMALVAALGLPLALPGSFAWAHGTTSNPPSREYFCKFLDKGGVENPQSDGCKAAKAAAGTGEVYNFNGILVSNAARRGLDAVPDGQICNAGNATYNGFNLVPAQAKYTATPVTGGTMTFSYLGTAAHTPSDFTVYISKPSYDGSRQLMKSDLDVIAKFPPTPALAGDTFRFDVTLPSRPAGSTAVILTQWNREAPQSDEGYYNCSDVVYK